MSFIGSASSATLGFLLIFAVARLLGDVGAGILIQVIAIFSLVTVVAKFGLDSASLWLLPRVKDANPSRLRAHILFVFAVSMVAGVAAGILTSKLAPLLISGQGDHEAVAQAVVTVSWAMPLGVGVLVAMAISRSLGAIVPFVIYGNVGLPALRLIAVLVAIALGASASQVSLAWVMPLIPVLTLLVLDIQRRTRGLTRRRLPAYMLARADRRRVLGFALPRTVASSLEQALVWLDVIIVGAIAGTAAAGVYGSASRFIAAGLIIDTAIRVIVSPRFSLLLHRGDLAGVQYLYRTATIWLVLFGAPGFIVLGTFSPVVLSWLGPEFVNGSAALALLCAGAACSFLAGNIHSLLLMSGHPGWASFNKLVAVSISALGTLMLVPKLGITGAALAWTVAIVADATLAAIEVHILLGVRPEIFAGMGTLALVGLAVGFPSFALRWSLGTTWAGLLAASLVSVATLSLSIWVLRRRLQFSNSPPSSKLTGKQPRDDERSK